MHKQLPSRKTKNIGAIVHYLEKYKHIDALVDAVICNCYKFCYLRKSNLPLFSIMELLIVSFYLANFWPSHSLIDAVFHV